MTVWRVCEGTGRFPHCIKEGGTWGDASAFKQTRSEPEASDGHPVSLSEPITRV
jgi:hypothetical protein